MNKSAVRFVRFVKLLPLERIQVENCLDFLREKKKMKEKRSFKMKKFFPLMAFLSILYASICFGAEPLCCTLGEETACCATIGRKWCPKEGECRTKCLDELCPDGYIFDTSLMKCKKMPYARQVEYIQSTGTQYIDTGITIKNYLTLKVDMVIQSNVLGNSSTYLFGVLGDCGGNIQYSIHRNDFNTNQKGYIYSLRADNSSCGTRASTIETIGTDDVVHIVIEGNKITINDYEFINDFDGSITDDTNTLYLSAWDRIGGANNVSPSKIYYFDAYRNGNKIISLIPVVDWDGVACLYDKISGELFYNQGTGQFLVPEN